MFHTGFISKETYGTKDYFTNHPQLSNELIDALLEKNICIIGIDCAGVKRGSEHTPKDQYCADRGVFIIENLCNLEQLLNGKALLSKIIASLPGYLSSEEFEYKFNNNKIRTRQLVLT